MLMTSIIGKKEYSHKVFDSFSQGASVVIIYTCGTKNISLNNVKNVACFELNMAQCYQGIIAGACQPSKWAVTRMDVHSLVKGV